MANMLLQDAFSSLSLADKCALSVSLSTHNDRNIGSVDSSFSDFNPIKIVRNFSQDNLQSEKVNKIAKLCYFTTNKSSIFIFLISVKNFLILEKGENNSSFVREHSSSSGRENNSSFGSSEKSGDGDNVDFNVGGGFNDYFRTSR